MESMAVSRRDLVVLLSGLVFVLQLGVVNAGGSVNDSNTLITDILTGYNTMTRPTSIQSDPVNVSVMLNMKSIQDFDEVFGRFSILGSLVTKWNDPSLVWTPGQYGGIETLVLPFTSIWYPALILSSASSTSNTITQSWNKVIISYTGDVKFTVSNLIESKCDVNVKNYPFDLQFCQICFVGSGYSEDQLNITSEKSKVSMNNLKPNVLWQVTDSEIIRELSDNGEVELFFGIRLQRKSSGVVTVVLLPILMLGMLNVFVFLLVPESGERIGYCITTLLAIAVYMTIVADMLPQSADPVPVICFKLMVDMIISTMIVLTTILNLKVFNKREDEPVPKWLISLYFFCKCTKCKKKNQRRNSINVLPFKHVSSNGTDSNGMSAREVKLKEELDQTEPNWQEISRFIDWVSFYGYNMASLISFAVFVLATSMAE